MRHRLFAALSVLSLVICIVAIIADVVSRSTTFGWTSHHIFHDANDPRWTLGSHNHDLVVSNGILYEMGEDSGDTRKAGGPTLDEHRVLSHADVRGLSRDRTTYGFSWHETRRIQGVSGTFVRRYWQRSAPLWFIAVVGGIVPTLWLLTFLHTLRRKAHLRAGRCPVCGYDLRASKDRCPECGTRIRDTEEQTARSTNGSSSRRCPALAARVSASVH